MVLLLGVSLAGLWRHRKTAVLIMLLLALLGDLTIVNNLGYRKYYRPDVIVPWIQSRSPNPVLIATTPSNAGANGRNDGVRLAISGKSG